MSNLVLSLRTFISYSLLSLCLLSTAFAQEKRVMEAVRIDTKIKIDGDLSDEAWASAKPYEGNFFQMSPDNGAPSAYKTKVSIIYNNYAIYIGAIMYDPDPQSIPQELGVRDDGDKNVDMFGIVLDTYNKGQNGNSYVVSAAGVQSDAAFSTNDMDDNWDAVWKSDIKITEEGWVAEMEIPYSALRFPKNADPTWGLNIYRASKRLNEEATWNFVDASVDGFLIQAGELIGLKDIKPPLRLSFFPYLAAAANHDGASNTYAKSISGGMDLKLGISESFTLDVSLIPDFSQVQSDNVVLNLSPFEVRFDENRPFFTEGIEMFNKGRIFYSRRVGQSFGDVDEDDFGPNEELKLMPTAANLINATKLSGRTGSGTGLGFFNAMTKATYATIRDTETGEERQQMVDPFTNFNVFVVDQNLKNNSYVGLINTNVMRKDGFRDANVTLGDFRFRDKTNTWSLSGTGGLSQIFTNEEGVALNTKGFRSNLYFSKVSGKVQFNTGMNVESDQWYINDLGYQRNNNEVTYRANISYNLFKPFSVFNNMSFRTGFEYEQLYKPNVFTSANLFLRGNAQFKNFYRLGIGLNYRPVDQNNYWEPREEGRYVTFSPNYNFFVSMGSDRRKPLRVSGYGGFWSRPEDDSRSYFGGLEPTYRISNKMNLSYDLNFDLNRNDKGFVDKEYDANDELENIIFGNRDQNTFTNTVGISYTFNRNMALTFRLRHYWTWVEYDQFYDLSEDGKLLPSDYDGFAPNGASTKNTSFNALNIDMVYTWQIAPGSFVTAVWKDAIQGYVEGGFVQRDFMNNFSGVMRENHYNTISLKVIYYVDIAYFRKKTVN